MTQNTQGSNLGERMCFALGASNLSDDAGMEHLVRCVDDLVANLQVRKVKIDLAHVPYISSRVLNELLRLRNSLRDRGVRLRLFNAQPNVREVLRVCRLERVFRMDGVARGALCMDDAFGITAETDATTQSLAKEKPMAGTIVMNHAIPMQRRSVVGGNKVANEHQIARLAYAIWERRGRPVGHSLSHWLQAESMLSDRLNLGRRRTRKQV